MVMRVAEFKWVRQGSVAMVRRVTELNWVRQGTVKRLGGWRS
jgi:hypothetical protein